MLNLLTYEADYDEQTDVQVSVDYMNATDVKILPNLRV